MVGPRGRRLLTLVNPVAAPQPSPLAAALPFAVFGRGSPSIRSPPRHATERLAWTGRCRCSRSIAAESPGWTPAPRRAEAKPARRPPEFDPFLTEG